VSDPQGEIDMSRRRPSAALALALAGAISAANASAQETSNNWSGYVVQGAANPESVLPATTFSSVSAAWTQPVVDCTVANARVSIWVGIDGWSSPTVEQVGTEAVCGAAVAPEYYKAWWEMYAGSHSAGKLVFDISPGDRIEASVTYSGSDYIMSLVDRTSGQRFTTEQTCDPSVTCNRSSAEWIVERPGGGTYPLADYLVARFYDPADALAGQAPTAFAVDMFDKSTKTTLSHCAPPTAPESDIVCKWRAAE
jgi:hypothetical protein